MKKILRALWLCCLCLLPTLAVENTVKVACILDHGFFVEEENGGLSGYNYDYLMMIAQHTGWNYEFVMIDQGSFEESFAKAEEMLQTGEIDLLGNMFQTPEGEEMYEFPNTPVGISRYTLVSFANNYKITKDNYFLQESLSVALVEGDIINETYLETTKTNNYNTDILYVPTYAEALERLRTEQVEAIVVTDSSQDAWMLNTLTTLEREPFYFVAAKGQEKLMEQINEALEKIAVEEPNVTQRLLTEYFSTLHKGNIILTSEEEEALANYDYLTVGLLKGREPYQFYSGTEEAVPNGISVDILEEISEIIGMEFRYVWLDSRQEMKDKIASQEIDICSTVPFDSDYELTYFFDVIITQPYLTNAVVWLHQMEEKDSANPHYYYIADNIPLFPDEELTEVFDFEGILKELGEKGDISVFADPYMAQYQLQKQNITNVEMQSISAINSKICFGIGKHLDSAVVGLINHSLLHLDPFVVDEIIYDNVTVHAAITLEDFLEEHKSEIYTVTVCFLAIVVLSLLYYSKKLKRLSQQDSLTKLLNAGYFHQYAEERCKKLTEGCLILIDIDFFKQVNDTYGHQQGDTVIIRVAQALQTNFRPDDIIARLGGDEFIVFLEYKPDKEDLEKRFRTILETLSHENQKVKVTLSIGGSIFTSQTDYVKLYHTADQVLYQVKEKGRNGFLFEET